MTLIPHAQSILNQIRDRYDTTVAKEIKIATIAGVEKIVRDYDSKTDLQHYPELAQVLAVRDAMRTEGFRESEINEILLEAEERVSGKKIDAYIKRHLTEGSRPLSREMSDRLWRRSGL